MARTYRWWTMGELRRLEGLRLKGLTRKQIAAELGRPVGSVTNQIRHRQIPLGGQRLLEWWRLVQVPHTNRQVARAMGVGVWAAKGAKRRLVALGYEVCRSRGQGWRKKDAVRPDVQAAGGR
jgi:hypothetical protein